MDKLLDSLANINIRKNDGYIFVKKDEVFVPIIKTILSVTKRSFYALSLLDEIVLRLISEGVQEIDELVNILGIDRKLLEVTLADLSVKDIIYCTTNRCSLMVKGKEALRELKTIQRRKDTIKNVYLDPINKKVLVEHENYQFLDKVRNYDKKLDADFELNNIDVFKENIDSVNTVFLDEMNIYNDKTKSEPDELLSIDSIENVYSKFVHIPIYIYVSTNGYDIDILSVSKKNEQLLFQFKDEIIDQIRKKKILKNTFVKYGLRNTYPVPADKESLELRELLVKYKRNKGDRENLAPILVPLVLSNRKLFDEEFEVLLTYFVKESKEIELNISYLDDWAKNELSTKVLSIIGSKKIIRINYSKCYDFRKALSLLQRTLPEFTKDKLVQSNFDCYFSVIFDKQYVILGVPNDIKIIDSQTHIHKVDYYLSLNFVEG